MFGTIGHAHPKAGHLDQINSLMDDWNNEIRPTIPGDFITLAGSPKGHPDDYVFIALAKDEPTYRALADSPAQDAWFQKLRSHLDGDVTWEDVQMEFSDRMRAHA